MNILIFILILFVLVVVHEFGHFFAAKKFGMRVDEFSFGFPPKIFGKKIGETMYKLNLIPLGGYVKIHGENGLEDEDKKDIERSFTSKPRYAQAAVLFAGVFMNFVLAWFLLSTSFLFGVPSSISGVPDGYNIENKSITITSIMPSSIAEKADLKTGDQILSLQEGSKKIEYGKDFTEPEVVVDFIKQNENKNIVISLLRAKEVKNISVIPSYNKENNQVMVGFSMDEVGVLKLPVHMALWQGLKFSSVMFFDTLNNFINLIQKSIVGQGSLSSITGPIGIVGVVGDAASFGFVYLLSFTALISINLAVINLIPFPALDGGRLLFLLIEKIKGSPIKTNFLNWSNTIGFGILILLMILVTYNDIVKLF